MTALGKLGCQVLLAALSTSAAAAATAGPVVEGSARQLDGSPAVGARVDLVPLLPRATAGRLRLANTTEIEPLASATVDANGRYRLEAAAPGSFRIRARLPQGLVWELSPLVLHQPAATAADPSQSPVELAPIFLTQAEDKLVRAFDADGGPLAGGWIRAASHHDRSRRHGGWRPTDRLVPTDTEGLATLPSLGSEILDLSLVGPGGIFETRRGVLEGAVQLRLPTAATAHRILLTDPRGRPLAGIIAHLDDLAWPIGVTDAAGSLTVLARRDSSTPVLLTASDGHGRSIRLPNGREPAGKDSAGAAIDAPAPPIRLRLQDPVAITGQVLEAQGRRPLAGALIWPEADPGALAAGDAEGHFELVAPDHAGFWLQAEAPGHLARCLWIPADRLAAGTRPIFELPAATAVAGRVVDPAGRPIGGVHLAIFARTPRPAPRKVADEPQPGLHPDPAADRARSDQRGGFVLGGLEGKERYVLEASHPGFARARVAVEMPASSGDRLEIVLRPERTVFGRVVDVEDRPLAGARVALTAPDRPTPLRLYDEAGAASGDAPARDASRFWATTGADGRFTNLPVPAEVVKLTVFSKGFVPTTVRGIRIPAARSTNLGTVVMLPGLALRGKAIDEETEGVPGVRVYVLYRAEKTDQLLGNDAYHIDLRKPDAVTNARGEFEVADLRAGERLHLLFRRDGYRTAWLRHVEVPASESLSVQLQLAATVRGRVIDEDGEPVAGAGLALTWGELPADDLPETAARAEAREATTDVDGRFAFTDTAPGEAVLEVEVAGFVTPEPLTLTVPPAGTSPEDAKEITITLARGAAIEGLVESEAGEPIANARVRARGAQAFSDAGGLYRVAGVPIATVELEVDHEHYGSQRREIAVEPGINHHDFIFEDGFEITGRVVDEAGEAVAGAALLFRSTRAGDFRYLTSSSDGDGWFRLAPVVDGRYRLEARKDGYVPREPVVNVTVAGVSIEDLELVMARGAVVRGQVLGLDFDQLARVKVTAETPGRPPRRGSVDYEGRYQVRDLAAGDWLLRAALDGGRRQAQARVSLAPGVPDAARDLEFSRGLRLDGYVLQDGEPVAGAALGLRGYQQAVERSVISDHEGAFRIDDLEPGSYHLELTHAQLYLVHNQDLELRGDRQLVIDLRPAKVEGRVEIDVGGDGDGDGVPLAEALVVLRRLPELGGEANVITTGTDAGGRYYFPRVPPGRYRLTVRKDGYAADETPLDLARGEQITDLMISVRATAGVRLLVSLAGGGSPAYVNVAVLDAAGGSWLRESRPVAAGGLVELATVPPGAWRLHLSAPGATSAGFAVEVPGEAVPVVLQPAARLRVEVPELSTSDQIASLQLFAPSGQPFRDLDEYATLRETWSMVAGKTVVDHLPAGSWTVVVQGTDGRSWSGAVTVGAGAESGLRLE